MLFRDLQPSSALSLQRYADVDDFRESERYVRAESIPLSTSRFCSVRASLSFPSCVLSLVRTFPRIIKGYELPGGMILVIPMDEIASTKTNGEPAGSQSLILLKGSADCTIHEPEGRLVAILSIGAEFANRHWRDFSNGHLLLRLQPFQLVPIQRTIKHMLELAAKTPELVHSPDMRESMQDVLLEALDVMICSGEVYGLDRRKTLDRYKEILDRIDARISTHPTVDPTIESLAEEIGVSVRTLQTASRSLCGVGLHKYSRLRRLWSVRRQLRTGAAGLTVKASALANGFWHMGEFASSYRTAFGESPSATLARSKEPPPERGYAALAPS